LASIDVKHTIFKDDRFIKLAIAVGSRELAMGVLIYAWDLAYDSAHTPSSYIPEEQWARLKHHKELVECGLAEHRDGGVYVRGSGSWVTKLRNHKKRLSEAGRRGGLKSQGNLRSQNNAESSQMNVPVPIPVPVPVSVPVLIRKDNYIDQSVDRSRHDLEIVYKNYPRKQGKQRGMKTAYSQVKTDQDYTDLQTAVANYSAYCKREISEPRYIKQFSTFMSEWRDWVNPENGTSSIALDATTKTKPARRGIAEILADDEKKQREVNLYEPG